MGKIAVARRIDAIEARADHRERRTRGRQCPGMRGGIHADGQARDDGEPGLRQGPARKRARSPRPERSIAAADDRQRGSIEEFAASDEKQRRRRETQFEQRTRIVGVIPGDDLVRRGRRATRGSAAIASSSMGSRMRAATTSGTTAPNCARVAASTETGSPNARSSATSDWWGRALSDNVAQASGIEAATDMGKRMRGGPGSPLSDERPTAHLRACGRSRRDEPDRSCSAAPHTTRSRTCGTRTSVPCARRQARPAHRG